jgi:spore germination cell wall hydrolase CwlJ-like protein
MPELLGKKAEHRWLMHIEQPSGNSIASIDTETSKKATVDRITTGSVSASLEVSETVRITAEPQRINRALKGKRVVQTTARSAPKDFSAGSVLERQSMMQSLQPGKKFARMFVKPKPSEEAMQVASAFHVNKPKDLGAPKDLPVMVASLVEQSRSSILSYAPEPKLKHSPFSAVLVEEQPVKILPRLNKGDHSWADDPLPKNSFSHRQQQCLARGIYFEARGEPVKGQAAVSQVILNRVRNPHYPNSICGVVYQNKHWRNRCQFSFACDRIKDRINNKRLFSVAEHVAAETTSGRIWLPEVGSSTHYHATYVNPKWNKKMKRLGKIGLHIFYRTYKGGWS